MTLQIARVSATTTPTSYGTLQVASVSVVAASVAVVPAKLQVSSVKVVAAGLIAIPNAGADQSSIEPWATVTLVGSVSGGTAASYNWSQAAGTPVALTGTGATRTFVAPATMNGDTLLFGLTVTDVSGNTSQPDTVAVVCLPETEFKRVGGAWVPRRQPKRSGGTWV